MAFSSPVTYPGLADISDEYEYDDTIGVIGGFKYYKNGVDDPVYTCELEYENVGDLTPSLETISVSDVQQLFLTTVQIGTRYGWSHEHNCWAYFVSGLDQPADYTSAYFAS
jgi:hypothetical protein